ncbi:MAG: DedA family protein [Candidatus Omnitrophica bacterium]|nr:DedA family protein [Candidatus Omnitrophota bacterium]
MVKDTIEFVFHVDKHLASLIQSFGTWSYFILFATVFAETGLVVTPFLPGDSLLFAAGVFAAKGVLDIWKLSVILMVAAIIGDSVNYAIGKAIGLRICKAGNSRFFKKKYLDRTHAFYEKHGGKTIILARFIPIVRTFAPFLAGAGSMSYPYFLIYNIAGAVLWVGMFVGGGFYFGNAPIVKENFSIVVFVIIFLSLMPPVFEVWRHKMAKKRAGGS